VDLGTSRLLTQYAKQYTPNHCTHYTHKSVAIIRLLRTVFHSIVTSQEKQLGVTA